MSHKQPKRSRTRLTVEALEDRTLLTGNVSAFMFPFPGFLGHLIILDDLASNNFSINAAGGVLTVLGKTGPGTSATAVNGGLSASFALSSVNEIDINNPSFFGNPNLVFGNNNIQIGNTGGFSIAGNIIADFGAGHDMLTMNKIGDNITQFTGTFGAGTGSDTVTTTNSVQGASLINPGSGTNVMSYTGDTMGVISIHTPVSTHNQTLQILNSTNGPAPRSAAIGAVLANLSPGASTGNNTITIAGDSIGLAQIQSGQFTGGDKVSNTATITNDTITGAFFRMALLNGSGLNNGNANASVNNVTTNSILFTNGGSLTEVVDDGPTYMNPDHSVKAASLFNMSVIDLANDVHVTLGRNFQNITAGNSDTGKDADDIDARTFELTAWRGADRVKLNVDTTQGATIAVDQAASSTIGYFFDNGLATPQMTFVGNIGPASPGTIGGAATSDLAFFIGDNWPLTVSPVVVTGNLFVNAPPSFTAPFFIAEPSSPIAITNNPGNGLDVTVTSATVGGLLQIFEGSGSAVNSTQSVTVGAAGAPVSAGDLDIQIFSANLNGVGTDANLTVTNTTVNDPLGLVTANVQDHGSGNDLLQLGGGTGADDPLGIGGGSLTVTSILVVQMSSGLVNLGYAENVSALVAVVDGGGSPASDLFEHNDPALIATNWGSIVVI
jgi:hypothetical protein